jgi:RNA polymerase sigma-70 factor (ECF subfamily)
MGLPADLPRKIAPTRWSLVRRAGDRPTAESRAALEELCRLYWYPLYAFARRRGEHAEEAHDLTQGFLARLIDKNDLAAADPDRGRFRSWLRKSFDNFLHNAHDHARARTRFPGQPLIALDATDADGRYALEPSHDLTPERLYERRWTLELQARALGILKAEYEGSGKLALFEALKGSLIWDDGPAHAELAESLQKTPAAIRQDAHRLRKRYGEIFYDEVAQTVEDPEDVEDEVRRLLDSL